MRCDGVDAKVSYTRARGDVQYSKLTAVLAERHQACVADGAAAAEVHGAKVTAAGLRDCRYRRVANGRTA